MGKSVYFSKDSEWDLDLVSEFSEIWAKICYN